MSRTGVIVALVVMLLLAGALWLANGKGKAAPAAKGPLLVFDAARVMELRLFRPGGAWEIARRGNVPGDWEIALGTPGKEEVWLANPGRVRAALRILSTLEPVQEAEDGAIDTHASEFDIKLEDGSTKGMLISSAPLGGRVLVQAPGGRLAWVTQDISDMLVGTGIREWRERSAFPGLGPDTSRITLKGEKGTVALARVQGRWGVREPVQEAAEPEAVVKLVTALQNIEVTDFLDGGPPERTGLDQPVATITIEADQRDADGTLHTSSRTLVVGQQADIAGKSVFASVQRGSGSRVVAVGAEGLASLTTDPAAYVSRRSISAPQAEIGKAEVAVEGGEARVYERTIDGWKDGAGATLTKQDVDSLQAAIGLLAQTPADAVAVSEKRPEAWGPAGAAGRAGVVRLASLGGAPIGEIRVFLASGAGARPETKSGTLWRLYPAGTAPIAAWLLR